MVVVKWTMSMRRKSYSTDATSFVKGCHPLSRFAIRVVLFVIYTSPSKLVVEATYSIGLYGIRSRSGYTRSYSHSIHSFIQFALP